MLYWVARLRTVPQTCRFTLIYITRSRDKCVTQRKERVRTKERHNVGTLRERHSFFHSSLIHSSITVVKKKKLNQINKPRDNKVHPNHLSLFMLHDVACFPYSGSDFFNSTIEGPTLFSVRLIHGNSDISVRREKVRGKVIWHHRESEHDKFLREEKSVFELSSYHWRCYRFIHDSYTTYLSTTVLNPSLSSSSFLSRLSFRLTRRMLQYIQIKADSSHGREGN